MIKIKNASYSSVFEDGESIINKNRINLDEYQIVRQYSAGIVLQASEVKCLHSQSCSLKGSYCSFRDKALVWIKGYIKVSEYQDRVLLLKHKELNFIRGYLKNGFVLTPVSVYKVNNLIKIKLILAKYIRTLKKKREKARDKELNSEMKLLTR